MVRTTENMSSTLAAVSIYLVSPLLSLTEVVFKMT